MDSFKKKIDLFLKKSKTNAPLFHSAQFHSTSLYFISLHSIIFYQSKRINYSKYAILECKMIVILIIN
jgi:hypothetical protein